MDHLFILLFVCFFQTTGNIHNFCEVGLKIAGIVPIYSPPALTYSHSLLTSVAVSTTEQHTVAFLGTSDGHMKKVKQPVFVDKSTAKNNCLNEWHPTDAGSVTVTLVMFKSDTLCFAILGAEVR